MLSTFHYRIKITKYILDTCCIFLAVESEVGTDSVPVGGSTNQSSAEQATGTLPSSTSSEQNARFDQLI